MPSLQVRTLPLIALAVMAFGCSGRGVTAKACKNATLPRLVELAPAGDVAQEKSRGIKGTTSIEVLVGLFEGGGTYMAEAKVLRSSGVPNLDRAAMYAVRYSTFASGTCDGKPAAGKVVVDVSLP